MPECLISRVLSDFSVATISLGRPLPDASSNLPGSQARRATSFSPIWSFSEWGLPSRRRHRLRWCALTAPFHPCRVLSPAAVSSLWHFPWDHSRWGLPSTLPFGARTFLRPRKRDPRPPVALRTAVPACYAGIRVGGSERRFNPPHPAPRSPARRRGRSPRDGHGGSCTWGRHSGASPPARGATA